MASISCVYCGLTHGSANEARECFLRQPVDRQVEAYQAAFANVESSNEPVIYSQPAGEDFFDDGQFELAKSLFQEYATQQEAAELEQELREDHPGYQGKAEPSGGKVKNFILNVPFPDKDEAKALGAKWDPQIKKWYVPAGQNAAPFKKWWFVKSDGTPAKERVALVDGWYKIGDTFAKVVHNKAETAQYAYKLVVQDEEWRKANPNKKPGKWVYTPGLINRLVPENKLTEAEAVEFGKLYTVCGICGASLSMPESIARGIGPKCAQKMGW